MRFLTAETLFFIVILTDYIRSELSPDGKNVCLKTENYEETVMVQVQRLVKDKKWCWKVRCSNKKAVYETRPKVFNRTRIVPKCCDGYREETGKTDCVPICLEGCKTRKCSTPYTCDCDPGFHGPTCEKECLNGRWGKNCLNVCYCSGNGECKKTTGCDCNPGWKGEKCDIPCEEGYYGYRCEKKCNCDLGCNHKTGECITNTTGKKETTEQAMSVSGMASGDFVTKTSNLNDQVSEEASQKPVKSEVSEPAGVFTEIIDSFNRGEKDGVTADVYSGFSEINTEKYTKSDQETEVSDEDALPLELDPRRVESFTNEVTEYYEEKIEETPLDSAGTEINLFSAVPHLEEHNWEKTYKEVTTVIHINDIFRGQTEKNELNYKRLTTSSSLTEGMQQPNKNMTAFLNINGKENSQSDYLYPKFHFLASLSILSSISLIIFVIIAKWVLVSHKRKVQKIVFANQKEKTLKNEKMKKCKSQNLPWVNSYTDNPTYLLDVDKCNSIPVLQTFKPLPPQKTDIN